MSEPKWIRRCRRIELWLNRHSSRWSLWFYRFDPDKELRSAVIFGLRFYYQAEDKDLAQRAERTRCHEAAMRVNQCLPRRN